jgi:hypothetical protein
VHAPCACLLINFERDGRKSGFPRRRAAQEMAAHLIDLNFALAANTLLVEET